MQRSRVDHVIVDVGRLGNNIEGTLVGGDLNTWGLGAEEIGTINIITPTRGTVGECEIICNREKLDLQGWDIEYTDFFDFLKSNLTGKFSDDEIQFVMWYVSRRMFGDDFGVNSGFPIDEWPVDDLEERMGGANNLPGKLILNHNKRFDCTVSIDEDCLISWDDEVEPDDDAQFVAVFNGN